MPNDNVFSLVEKRPAVKLTPPVELVEEWLAEMKSQAVELDGVAIHFFVKMADGTRRPRTWTANISTSEEIALAVLMQRRGLESWLVDA